MMKFEQELAGWDHAKMQDFLRRRWEILTEGAGNLCIEPAHIVDSARFPFESRHYEHKGLLGSVTVDPWPDILAMDPSLLLHPDPFAKSKYRDTGYACWDAAVGIPADRSRGVQPMAKIAATRSINNYWSSDVMPAICKVGPLGPNKSLLRPVGKYIIDFKQIENGWLMLEAAHTIAHLRGDSKTDYRSHALGLSKLAGHRQAAVAEMAVALLYDLPLDIGLREDGTPAMADFRHFGLEVKSSSRFDAPYLRLPWNGREALRFDNTLAVVSVAVMAEPHPHGFTDGTLIDADHDKWCCMPTIAVIVGWETVDVITHQPLVSSDPTNKKAPICYGIHPADLMPPDDLWAYLKLGVEARGLPPVDGMTKRVADWMNSPDFMHLLAQTPPLPCQDCFMWNSQSEGGPKRPRGLPPKKLIKGQHDDWIQWKKDVKSVHGIIDKAVKRFERKLYGSSAAADLRRARKSNHKLKMEQIKNDKWYAKALKKKREGARLTDYERSVYDARRN